MRQAVDKEMKSHERTVREVCSRLMKVFARPPSALALRNMLEISYLLMSVNRTT